MKLKTIELDQLKISAANVRKKKGKEIADLVPSIRARGLLQPLLVRPNCEGYEIVAGQRRYHALLKLAEEGYSQSVPCLVMAEGDDAAAIEASLAENIARLPMDEIDQYKAFAALVKQGRSAEDIAADFGITERLVSQRLAIANLIPPLLNAYAKEEIDARTIRALTLASKRQQREWWRLFTSEEQNAPMGAHLKDWLMGGAGIPVEHALFDVERYPGAILTDLFGEERYFDDAAKFWELQNTALADLKQRYIDDGWQDVEILEIGAHFASWDHVKAPKKKGGRVYFQIARDGEITVHEGFLPHKQAARRDKSGEEQQPVAQKAEITSAMQNYLGLHRHSVVRCELLKHPGIALRLAVAQIVAGSELWDVRADRQHADSQVIAESLAASKAEAEFAGERQALRVLLGLEGEATLCATHNTGFARPDLHEIFSGLLGLSDDDLMRALTFTVAETLASGSVLVEALGVLLKCDMAAYWQPDQPFFDLLRDKETINAIVREVAGKNAAAAHTTSTAKIQKKIVADALSGQRSCEVEHWQPRYMSFPMKAYTKRGGIEAMAGWSTVKRHYR